VPKVRKEQANALYQKLMQAHDQKLLESCHDCSDGGMAVALAESTFGTDLGVDIQSGGFPSLSLPAILFSESHSRFVVSVTPENQTAFESLMGNLAISLGEVTETQQFIVSHQGAKVVDLRVDALLDAWNKGLNI
jgi:phosphoribosylformylglycinamidine synthase